MTSLGKIFTPVNLRKCQIIVRLVFMCKSSGESIDHLLLHCEIVMTLWEEFFAWVGITWMMPRRVIDLLASWRGLQGNYQIATIWKMVPVCLRRCLWREMNEINFEDQEQSMNALKNLFSILYSIGRLWLILMEWTFMISLHH